MYISNCVYPFRDQPHADVFVEIDSAPHTDEQAFLYEIQLLERRLKEILIGDVKRPDLKHRHVYESDKGARQSHRHAIRQLDGASLRILK